MRTTPVNLRISDRGLALITEHEGAILHAYDDADPTHRPIRQGDPVRGTLTIGTGHTRTVFPGMVISDTDRLSLLRSDVREAESLVHRNVRCPLEQDEFDALTSLIFNVGPGRIAGSNGPDDKGKAGIITLANGLPSSLLRCLNEGKDGRPDYIGAAHWFTAWKATKGFEYGLFRRRIAEMLLFMGLPWVRALNACSSLQFTIDEAVKLAEEEQADLDGLRPPAPQPAPAATPAPNDELVLEDPIVIPPKIEPRFETPEKGAEQAPLDLGPEAKIPAGEGPTNPAGKEGGAAATVSKPPAAPPLKPPPPHVPIGQQTGAVNATRNSEDWSAGLKPMIMSRRFWGLALIVAGRLWMMKTGSSAVLSGVSDPIITEMFSGFAVMLVGELVEWWGKAKATRPLR